MKAAGTLLGSLARGSDPLGLPALDGKRLRGSAPAVHDGSAWVHLVAAFASRLGGVMAGYRSSRCNELTAVLALLKALPLRVP